jgi:hypothetical protein
VASSCPRCGAATVSGMRACQFCGAAIEYTEPASTEPVDPEPLQAERAAEASPFETSAAEPPAHQKTDQVASPQVASGQITSPQGTSPAWEPVNLPPAPVAGSDPSQAPAPAAQDAVAKKAPKPRFRILSPPAMIGILALAFILFILVRVFYAFLGFNFSNSPGSKTAPQASSDSSSGAASAGDLGVDIYPGAQAVSAPGRSESSGGSVVSQSFTSPDKMDLVINFYKARMVGYTSIYASGNGVVVSINPGPQDFVQVAIAPDPGGGKTRISITRTTARSSN